MILTYHDIFNTKPFVRSRFRLTLTNPLHVLHDTGEPLRVPAGVSQPPYLRRESGAEIVWHCDYPLKEN